MTLTPAYGRDYTSRAALLKDFLAGKDFILNDPQSPWDGKLTSIRDMDHVSSVSVRYKKNRQQAILTRKGDTWR